MIAPRAEYSSELSGYLNLGGERFALGQLGPEYLILQSAADAPPGRGEIVLFHDGEESRFAVNLTNGISANHCKTPYKKLTSNN
jgi:hypothetical protein